MSRSVRTEDLTAIDPRRICVIKPSALGDIVQTLPLLPVLKDCYPEATIDWVVNRSLAGLLDGHPLINQLIPFDRGGGLRKYLQLLRTLRREKFDLVFDLQGLLRTGVMTWSTGARVRLGLECAREGAPLAYHFQIPNTRHGQPAYELYWRLAEILGRGEFPRETNLFIAESTRDWARELLATLSRPALTISAGAQWETKRWPAEKYADVAVEAARRWGFGICLVGSREERALAETVRCSIKAHDASIPLLDLAGETDLKQLAAVLAASDLVLSNDSGPMHLAAGLGTATVGVFLCTSPHRSGPYGDAHETVATTVPCAASYKKKCPQSGDACHGCFRELDADRVLGAVEACVAKNQHLRSRAA